MQIVAAATWQTQRRLKLRVVKPNLPLWPIAIDANNPINQSYVGNSVN